MHDKLKLRDPRQRHQLKHAPCSVFFAIRPVSSYTAPKTRNVKLIYAPQGPNDKIDYGSAKRDIPARAEQNELTTP